MRKIAGQKQQRILLAGVVPSPSRPRRAHQQDRPVCSARAGGEGLISVDDISAFDPRGGGPEFYLLHGGAGLRLSAPRYPGVAPVGYAAEPALTLPFGGHPV